MDRRHLPLLQETARPVKTETNEAPLTKIAASFALQRFPLTEAGEALRVETERALATNNQAALEALADELPTVENPRLELFGDLRPENERGEIFRDIANIQVTKGCRHACDFCAAGAEKTVEIMPFAAILQIREALLEHEAKIPGALAELERDQRALQASIDTNVNRLLWALERRTRLAIAELPSAGERAKETQTLQAWLKQVSTVRKTCRGSFLTYEVMLHGIMETVRDNPHSQLVHGLHETTSAFLALKASMDDWYASRPCSKVLRREGLEPMADETRYHSLQTHFYDSDPFDYRDARFRHADGRPADYGDAVMALATEYHPVHITTAGWPKKDKVAQIAAEKIVEHARRFPERFTSTRVSVSPYEITARRDLEQYLSDIENTITTLARMPRGVTILFFIPGEAHPAWPMFQKVLLPAMRQLEAALPGRVRLNFPMTSDFSVPEEFSDTSTSQHDVMACMPGTHLWPDGTIARQRLLPFGGHALSRDQQAPTGSRPLPVGRLYAKRAEGTKE